MKNNNSTRRSFLKKSAIGTGIVFSGVLSSNSIKANVDYLTQLDGITNELEEGVFPFYKFVEDFNFGEFVPKDQGGKFIQMELIGSEKDEEIVEILKNGLVENNLGNPPDWSVFEKTELEKSVWFNRFYYLPSLARLYYLDKNIDHIKYMMDFLRIWVKDNPVEGSSKSRYNWFDMQVAWRSINLSWCYYLAKDGLSNDDKKMIYDLQRKHAKILMKDFGKKELTQFNHQSHGALALLYLGILFPSLAESEQLLETGIKIINHHIENAFYNDGGNVEQMFGYYPFMSAVFRDSFLLLKANNIDSSELFLPLFRKMYVYLLAIVQPDNTVPPINDSYEETVSYIIPTLASILGYSALPKKPHSIYFKDSQIGVIRSEINSKNDWYINFNAAKLIGAHAHAGRLAVNIWFNNNPILVDSGCCNYDNPLLVEWYRKSEAHNRVIIDGKSDFATSQNSVQWTGKRVTENLIENLIVEPEYKFLRMVSSETDETNSGVRWTRDVVLVLDKYLLIHDLFETSGEHTYETIFRFADLIIEKVANNNSLLIDGEDLLAFIPVEDNDESDLEIKEEYFGTQAKNIKTPSAIYKRKQRGIVQTTFLLKAINNKDAIEDIKITQTSDDTNCKINLICNEKKISMNIMNNCKEQNKIFSFQML